jgi:excisionase family DNA binding protein
MELTTAQVAKRLGVSRQRVFALVKTGRIKARKPSPALLLIDVKELAKVKVRKPGRPWPKKKDKGEK